MLSLFANPTVPFPSPYERASRALQLKADELGRRLVHLGSAVGSPWTQDEKLAALVAWLSIVYPPHAPQICGVAQSR